MNSFFEKILTEEARSFFNFLKENGVIPPETNFEQYYNKYNISGYSDGNPVYTQLSQELEQLNNNMYVHPNTQRYRQFYRDKKILLKSKYPELTSLDIKLKINQLWRQEQK